MSRKPCKACLWSRWLLTFMMLGLMSVIVLMNT